MKILFITQYYPPETGAPQNRLSGLAHELKKSGAEVVVLTAMPNYPEMQIHDSYKGKCFFKEEINSITVFRSWIYVSKERSIIKRLLNYFSFVKSSWFVSFRIKENFDYVLCESPPLFLGISAWLISRRRKAKFIFNVSDLWPESAEKLGIISNKFFLNLATRLEEFLYRKSFLITGQTQGIVKNISQRFPSKKVHWLPNGIDDDQFQQKELHSIRNEYGFADDDFLLIYAGIMGHAQGLEVILNAAGRVREFGKIKFILIGDGPEKEKLTEIKANQRLDHVFFYPSVSKDKIKNLVYSCNAAVIPLRKLDLFKGAIPSKIFEALMLEKPLLLGVDGEAKKLFIDDAKAGLYFEPENDVQLSESVLKLYQSKELCAELGKNGNEFVLGAFTRKMIAKNFLGQLKG